MTQWHAHLPKPVAFVFSGGASLGAIQVGMLKALLETAIRPNFVVGTSVGALNAAIVADRGFEASIPILDKLWKEMRTADVFPGGRVAQLRHYLSYRNSLFPNHSLSDLIVKNLINQQFDELTMPLGVMAVELLTNHGALFTGGRVQSALLASTAIPGIYPPVDVNGTLYVDGALVANLPLKQAIQLGAKSLVVLDAGEMCHYESEPSGLSTLFSGWLQASMRQRTRIEARMLAEQVPILYLPTPCSMNKNLFDFSATLMMMNSAESLTRSFLQDAAQPRIGHMSGAPHHHDSEPIHDFTKIVSA